MRTKLTDKQSIAGVIADLTLEEKLNLVGEYKACHTLEIPDMNIPALGLYDGATGINGTQVILDYITAPDFVPSPENAARFAYVSPEVESLNQADLGEAREKYSRDTDFLGLIDHIEKSRPDGKQHISFPSGINIGASFSTETARKAGEAAGRELRYSKVDLCMGPNVDVARDPLGGRNYEMYGEDPRLVSEMSVGFIEGMQSIGVGACAKHFIANNQETRRNTTNNHISERALREIYSRGFMDAVQRAGVKCIMSAYNAVNGEYSSYNHELLTEWLRDEWGFQGVVVSDWGAVTEEKERSLNAGLDLILCGPNDMSGCKKALEDGRLTMEELDLHVERILNVIVELGEKQAEVPVEYNQKELLDTACQTIVDGSILLKNDGNVLPLEPERKIAFYGKRSKELIECGSGSTMVVTGLHSNVYDEYKKAAGDSQVLFETMDGADVLVYTAAAPAGENVDRDIMDIEQEDRERMPRVLKEAKAKGIKTVVLLNIAGPVDMRRWINDADAILTIFIPGCMGGVAAAALLSGKAVPSGKLPVTFPLRYQDAPAYPNFPGEFNDSYYGEGIFVGYRSYEKRDIPVQFPFGFGLSYTTFESEAKQAEIVFDTEETDQIEITVSVKNTGACKGSEVIQVYAAEERPHLLRPVKELVGFTKVCLLPGEEKEISVIISKDSLKCYDPKQHAWVLPIGKYHLYIGNSSADIFAEAAMTVKGKNPYPLSGESTIEEVLQNPSAVALINEFTGGMFDTINQEQLNFMLYYRLSDILKMGMISAIPDAVKVDEILDGFFEKLGELQGE